MTETVFIDIIPTSNFKNHYSNPGEKLQESVTKLNSYLQSVNERNTRSTPDAEWAITHWTDAISISGDTMAKRKKDAWNKIDAGNAPLPPDSSDCWLVLDFWWDGWGGQNNEGWADIGTAGTSDSHVALVDYELGNILCSDIHYIEAHEIGHVFTCYHEDVEIDSNGDATFMWTSDPKSCKCSEVTERTSCKTKYSVCSANSIYDRMRKINNGENVISGAICPCYDRCY